MAVNTRLMSYRVGLESKQLALAHRAGMGTGMIRQLNSLACIALLGAAWPAFAHNAICECFLNEDATITCEGGFSDGGTAVGVPVRILDRAGKVLIEGAMSEKSEYTFSKPAVDFRVEFDAGEGHLITIDGRDIEE